MSLLRNLFLLVLLAGRHIPVLAQEPKTKAPSSVKSLFDGLPIDEASANSALGPGVSGETKIKKNIFLVASLNKSICYTGEPILLTYQLYSAVQSKSVITATPSLDNFNVEERPLNNERPLVKKKDGKDYRVFTIYQVQLNPYQPGDLRIDSLSVSNEVSYTSDLDNKVHSYSGIVSSKAIALTVLPLPKYMGAAAVGTGSPSAETSTGTGSSSDASGGFSGAIGQFTLKAYVAMARIAAGETDTLCLEIAGAGNLNDIITPSIKWPAGFESFSSKEKWILVKNAFPPAGKKAISIPFIAHKEGRFSLAPIRFCYFDPSLKAYQELESGAVMLDILPALPGSTGTSAPVTDPPVTAPPPGTAWIVWSLTALGVSLLVFLLLRKKAHPYMGPAEAGVGELVAGRKAAVGGENAAGGRMDAVDGGKSTARGMVLWEVVSGGSAGAGDLGSETSGSGARGTGEMGSGGSFADEMNRDVQLAANAKRELESLSHLPDKVQYITGVKMVLSHFLQERYRTEVISGDELADALYRNTSDRPLAEAVRNVYTRCSEILYSPSDWSGVDETWAESHMSLAGSVNFIIERCEMHKNINR